MYWLTDQTQFMSPELCNVQGMLIDWLQMGSGPLLVPMHPGLNNGPLVPHVKLWEPCYFTKVPDGPQTYTLDVLWLQEKGG